MFGSRWTSRERILGVVLCAILLVTLWPTSGPVLSYTCIICGDLGLADAIANVVLFLPLGAALAGVAMRLKWLTWLVPLALSSCIEFIQQFVPGRDPSIGDVLFNSLGGILGIILVRTAHRWVRPANAACTRLTAGAAGAFALGIGLTGALFKPDLPPTVYWGLWTPDLGHLEWYRGQLLEARIGVDSAGSGPLANQGGIHDALRRGAPIVLRGVGGPSVRRLGAIFAIYDQNQEEILLIGPRGPDLILRYRMRATRIGLDQPELRLEGGMTTITPGAPFEVDYRHRADGVCLAVLGGLQKCGLGFDPGRGWSLIEYPVWLPGWLLHGLDAAWLAILSVPIGLWTARPRDLAIASIIMALALLPMPGWVGLQHATIVELFAAGGGVLLGRWLRSLAVR